MARKASIITIVCIILILIISIIGVSCNNRTRVVIKKAACESRYVKAYEDVVTDYEYKYDFVNGSLRLLPNTHTAKHKAVYQLKYRTIYDDLTFKDEWVDVSKAEYDEYEKIKNSGG